MYRLAKILPVVKWLAVLAVIAAKVFVKNECIQNWTRPKQVGGALDYSKLKVAGLIHTYSQAIFQLVWCGDIHSNISIKLNNDAQ